MKTPKNKMITTDNEITKKIKEKRPRKLRKFFFPQQGKMVEAENQKQAIDIISNIKEIK